MASVFPDPTSAGGVVYRDNAGAPTHPENVANAYPPAPAYVINCPPTALPSDCSARIEPRQVNAIVSELLAFSECLAPAGPWDCNSLSNLCSAWNSWLALNPYGIHVSDTPHPSPTPNETVWWESDSGMLFLWYDDGSSQQWVQINAGNAVIMDRISIIGAGTVVEPHSVGLIDCGEW